MQDVEGTIMGIKKLMESNLTSSYPTDAMGKKLVNQAKAFTYKISGIAKKDIEAFDNYMDLYLYGLANQSKDMTYGGKETVDENGTVISKSAEYSVNKTIQKVMQYTSLKAIGLSPVLAGANAIGIFTNQYMLSAGELYYTDKGMRESQKLVLKKDSKALAAINYFETSARNLAYEKAVDASAFAGVRAMTLDNAYILHKKVDDFADNTIAISMMKAYGIDKTDNKIRRLTDASEGTKSMWDNSKVNKGKLELDLTLDQKVQFRNMIQKVASRSKGSIPNENKNLIGTTIWGQSLMQFRNWIPGLGVARFGKLTYDENFENFDVGRFKVLVGEFTNSDNFLGTLNNVKNLLGEIALTFPVIRGLTKGRSVYKKGQNLKAAKMYYNNFLAENPDLRGKVTLEQYQKLRLAKLREVSSELGLYIALISLLFLAKMAVPDDDELEDNSVSQFISRNGFKVLNRGMLELSFWFSVKSVSDIIGSPLPSFRSITDMFKWVGDTSDVIYDLTLDEDDPRKAIWSKSSKDRKPLLYTTTNMIPFMNKIADLWDIFDKPQKR